MTSAVARRLEVREGLLRAHAQRADRVWFTEAAPAVVARGAVCSGGRVVRPAGVEVSVEAVPDGVLRLASLSGIGDAVWTRGVVRETLNAGLRVYLETPHEWLFWDFLGVPGFSFWREAAAPPRYALRTATYLGRDLRDGAAAGTTVYAAMCERCRVPRGDFRLAVAPEWSRAADAWLARVAPRKPLMIYRPLLANRARRAVSVRNPDPAAYAAVYAAIRERYHVLSVATAGAGEDIVHADAADTVCHRGELPLTTLAALMARAALVYTNPGMALVLACALGRPVIGVFGGYEDAHNYADTAVYGPALLLDPVRPCRCMSDAHACDKRMDVAAAVRRATRFCEGLRAG